MKIDSSRSFLSAEVGDNDDYNYDFETDASTAYVNGRNAFRDGKERICPTGLSDLERLNWETGYDDSQAEMEEE